jgi:hypothetical protein
MVTGLREYTRNTKNDAQIKRIGILLQFLLQKKHAHQGWKNKLEKQFNFEIRLIFGMQPSKKKSTWELPYNQRGIMLECGAFMYLSGTWTSSCINRQIHVALLSFLPSHPL